jgi:heme/copper-type cytochrome/quinol oxidase subunit 2
MTNLTQWLTLIASVLPFIVLGFTLWGFRRARKKADSELAKIRAEWSQGTKRQNTIQVVMVAVAVLLLIIMNAGRAYRAYRRHWKD